MLLLSTHSLGACMQSNACEAVPVHAHALTAAVIANCELPQMTRLVSHIRDVERCHHLSGMSDGVPINMIRHAEGSVDGIQQRSMSDAGAIHKA